MELSELQKASSFKLSNVVFCLHGPFKWYKLCASYRNVKKKHKMFILRKKPFIHADAALWRQTFLGHTIVRHTNGNLHKMVMFRAWWPIRPRRHTEIPHSGAPYGNKCPLKLYWNRPPHPSHLSTVYTLCGKCTRWASKFTPFWPICAQNTIFESSLWLFCVRNDGFSQ